MISICIIMKNEETLLDQCLQHLIPLGYEIVIVDTGSTDKSKEIALEYTDKVYDYQWKHDFADARNFAISKATNNFILTIDCDEFIIYYDKEMLERLVLQNPNGIGKLLLINNYARENEQFSSRERLSRLFNKSIYQYEGIVHEQIINIKGLGNTYYDIPIEIYHSGYDGDINIRSKKAQRNIELLEKQLIKTPEDPYILYQLGKSYYMQQDYIRACEWFSKALYFDVNPKLEYVQDIVESYGYALINSGQYETAMGLLGVYDEFSGKADFVYLIGLIYMNNARFTEAISEFIKATKMNMYKMDGVNSYRAFYNIGVIYECLGQVDKAKEYYEKCGGYEPALIRLKEI